MIFAIEFGKMGQLFPEKIKKRQLCSCLFFLPVQPQKLEIGMRIHCFARRQPLHRERPGSDKPGMETLLFPYRVRMNQLMNQDFQIA